jgi:beta-galactosidase
MSDMTDNMRVVYGDVLLGLHGPGFDYLFDYNAGPQSLVMAGKEWCYRAPQPAFWRATTDNDRGNGFSRQSAQWLGADLFSHVVQTSLSVDGHAISLPITPANNEFGFGATAANVTITYVYQTPTSPSTTVTVTYTIDAVGRLTIGVHYFGQPGLPSLPAFGLRFVMPTAATGFEYHGLPGETYPDRCRGEVGVQQVSGMPVTPYLVPQECGMHVQTDWLTLTRATTLNNTDRDAKPFMLHVGAVDQAFAFSCLPYLPGELENATHIEELPPVRRTVLTIYGAVRGVGGIDSWGAAVEPEYTINSSKDIDFAFTLSPQ